MGYDNHIWRAIITAMLFALCTDAPALASFNSPTRPHTDYRAGYSSSCSGGNACHTYGNQAFLPDSLDRIIDDEYTNFCLSCHNVVSEAHEKKAGSPSTNSYPGVITPTSGDSHSWNGVIGNSGTVVPSLAGMEGTTHMPGGNRVTCQVCHQGMGKTPDAGVVEWVEATTSDNLHYTLLGGYGATGTDEDLAHYVKVYRTATAMPTYPTYSRTRKDYLVSPSEYTYDFATATITFGVAQSMTSHIYVDISQPYFRVSNAGNALCLDCHADRQDTSASHAHGTGNTDNHPVTVAYGHSSGAHDTLKASPNSNIYIENGQVLCTSCHDVHNSASKDGQLTRNADSSALCADCHAVTGFDGNTTAYIANHNGAKHTEPTVCLDCHTPHNTTNIMLVRDSINGKSVSFRDYSGPDSFGNDTGGSVCEACHTATGYHLADGGGAGHNTGRNCLICHAHSAGFAGKGGGPPCYGCHNPSGGGAPDIKTLMGLGSSFDEGGKDSRHIIAFDNQSSSSCLVMCHTSGHQSGSPNLKVPTELELCNQTECHNGGTALTSMGNSISVGGKFAASMHNYTTLMPDEFGKFSYKANCTKCHLPHGSDEYPNLRPTINGRATGGNTEELCFGCHDGGVPGAADIESLWKADLSNNGHYDYLNTKKLNCVFCHGPHGTDNDSMITDELGGPGLSRDNICRACHSGTGSVYNVMGSAAGSYGPDFSAASVHDFGLNVAIGGKTVDLTCQGCHDPHNTANARLLQDRIVFSGLSQVTVQMVTAAIQPQGPVTQYQGGWQFYCTICHTSMNETGGQSPYRRHPVGIDPGQFYPHTSGFGMETLPTESGNISCISCHYTHGSPKHSLLRFQDSQTPENRMCLQCHDQDDFLQGGGGSHGGFIQNQGRCADCHNMHTLANKKLLMESTESVLCLNCHGEGGISKYNVWKDYTAALDPASLKGTAGTFGRYSELRGGTAHSMHDINDEASPAPGGVTTLHRCGTCHNPHGSANYRILRTELNNVTGIDVYAATDVDGNFINYSTGFVKFCSACHADYKVTDDGNGNWIRHPVGVSLTDYTGQDAFYENNTSYTPKVELESGKTVSCVSCHFAHGSGKDANLKFPGGSPVNACKTCHDRDRFGAGEQGSHAGFAGNDGTCSDCHSMHADGNAKLLKDGVETDICVNCHDNPGTSTSPNASHLDVWKGGVFDVLTSWFGTGGSFGTYDPVNGGNATSMHPVNSDARIAPGNSATVVHCGTCHDTHGSPNYRLLKTSLNGESGINVSATVDAQGRTLSYGSGMAGFCTACHKTYIECGTAAGYTRHPVNVALTAQELANYNNFEGGKYLPLESGNMVTCVTCHFAHGSPNPKMMRLPGNQMCQTCHAQGLDPAAAYQEVAYTHGGFNGNGGDCSVCHSMHASNNRKLLVYAEESELCRSCHAPDGVSRGSFPAAQVVWKGDAPSYPSEWDGTGGSFGAFYNSTTGGTTTSHHDINLTSSPAPGGTTTEHRCGTCHNPHGSNNYRLLRANVNGAIGISVRVGVMGNYSTGMNSFCTACHASYGVTGSGVGGYKRHPVGVSLTGDEFGNLTTSLLTNEPAAQVESGKVMCLSCHYAHGSPSYAMLRMQSYTSIESDLCQQCHMKGYKLETAGYRQVRNTHGGFSGNKANCKVCHSIHAKNNSKLLMESKESKLCDNCHSGVDSFNEFKTHDPDVVIDAPSRFNVFSTIGNSFGNYSAGGGDVVSWHEIDGTHTAPGGKTLELRCGKCHNPHGGDNFAMLRESVEGVNDIQVFGHLSSTGPFNTYSSGFAGFCSACHTRLTSCGTGDPWTRHPVDFQLQDTQLHNWSTTPISPRVPLEAGSQVTCITCHNSHGSKNYSLQRSGGNSMCQQCHKR